MFKIFELLFMVAFLYFGLKWIFHDSSNKNTDLRKALRRASYNQDYSDIEANVVALRASVEDQNNEVIIRIPTRNLWQLRTNPQVREELLERVDSNEFKHYLSLNFKGSVIFSVPKIKQNEILIEGSKSIRGHHFGPQRPKKW